MGLSVRWLALAVAGATSACAAVVGLDSYQEGDPSTSTVDAGAVDTGVSTYDVWLDEPSTDDAGALDAGTTEPTEASLAVDAAPPCGPMTCQQCCRNGACVGGASVNSCGINGFACEDCTDKGGACTNGACTTKVADAAPPPTCEKSKCGGCAPVWEAACCKSDGTCGCSMGFGMGPCE